MTREEAWVFDRLLAARRNAARENEQRVPQMIAGVDFGAGPDKTVHVKYKRLRDGTIYVHAIWTDDEDCGNQYTGGQDFG